MLTEAILQSGLSTPEGRGISVKDTKGVGLTEHNYFWTFVPKYIIQPNIL